MNKKILVLLAVFVVALSLASVSAAELTQNKDFDGLFKMNVAANDNFTTVGDTQDYSSLLHSVVAYKNGDESIFVLVYNEGMKSALMYITNGDVDYSYGKANADMDEDGDLTLLNKSSSMDSIMGDYNITTFAGKSNDDKPMTVFIGGTNETLVKEYAKTIELNG